MLNLYLDNIMLKLRVLPHEPDAVARVDGHHLGLEAPVSHVDRVVLKHYVNIHCIRVLLSLIKEKESHNIY